MTKTHKILMIACCLIGLGAAVAIFVFKVSTSSVVLGLMLLLCPLSHILMMRFMGHGHNSQEEKHHHAETPKELKASAGHG